MATSRRVLAALGVLAAATLAGATGCEKATPTPPVPKLLPADVDVPEVSGRGLAPATTAPSVVMSMASITVGGASVVSLEAGKVAAADREGGEYGRNIPALAHKLGVEAQAQTTQTTQTVSETGAAAPLVIAFDRAQSYESLYEVLFTAKPHHKSFAILVRAGTQPLIVPITLPDRRAPDDADAAGLEGAIRLIGEGKERSLADQPVGPVIAVTKTEAILWSISGMEGDLANPKAKVPLARIAELGAPLAEMVARRWEGTTRTPAQEEIILMCDPTTSMQTFAEAAQLALTPDAAGKPLFPRLILAAGMQ